MKPETSLRSRIERAASCRPAIQPSVASSSVATSSVERSRSITPLKNATASSWVKASSAAPISVICPRARSLERQRRIDAARNDEVSVLREVFQQERDDPVDGLGIDQIIVVENYGDHSRE